MNIIVPFDNGYSSDDLESSDELKVILSLQMHLSYIIFNYMHYAYINDNLYA